MTEPEAREFFLEKIRSRLSQEGHPLTGLELEYWEALKPNDEEVLDKLLSDKKPRKSFAAIEDKFEAAISDAIAHDLAVDSAARDKYLSALESISSSDGIQLQSLVFAAAGKFKELDESKPWQSMLILAGTLALIALGVWISFHLRK